MSLILVATGVGAPDDLTWLSSGQARGDCVDPRSVDVTVAGERGHTTASSARYSARRGGKDRIGSPVVAWRVPILRQRRNGPGRVGAKVHIAAVERRLTGAGHRHQPLAGRPDRRHMV